MQTLEIERTGLRLLPNARRVLLKPYVPGEESLVPGASRADQLMARILAIPESQVSALNTAILQRFESRHRHFRHPEAPIREGVTARSGRIYSVCGAAALDRRFLLS